MHVVASNSTTAALLVVVAVDQAILCEGEVPR